MVRHLAPSVVIASALGLFALAPHTAGAVEPWANATPLPEPASQRLAVVGDDGYVYLFGGRGAGAETDRYDPVADTFTARADVPVPTMGACGGQLDDGRIVVYGGSDPTTFNYVNAAQIYDPLANTWSQGATLDGAWACAAAADGMSLHVFGGQSQQTRYAIYDAMVDQWSTGPAIPNAQRRYGHIAILGDDDLFYLFGGRFSESTWSTYDPATQIWTEAGNLPGLRVLAGGATDGTNVFVIGGSNNVNNDEMPYLEDAFEMDLATGLWELGHPGLATGVRETSAVLVDGALHVFGGSNGALVDLHQVALLEPAIGAGSTGGDDGGSSGGDEGDSSGGDGLDTGGGSTDDGGGLTTGAGMGTDGGDSSGAGASAGSASNGDTGTAAPTTGGDAAGGDSTTTAPATSGGGATSTDSGCSCRDAGPPRGHMISFVLGLLLASRRRASPRPVA